jgi:hypothetical protein
MHSAALQPLTQYEDQMMNPDGRGDQTTGILTVNLEPWPGVLSA